ncbi:hypothetical protein LR48_Vigan04g032500 [Vigna angularis]|uniref:Uncharacterized protein n=1 Tax=Phaseolus angularis TaxID=3914 RepID=A0A0L9UC46_PHAAN|nr:hypothetical protein LR48_Vigan04g032500 [Vigna angularis]
MASIEQVGVSLERVYSFAKRNYTTKDSSKVISKEVKVNIATIAAIGCETYNNSFYEGWDNLYVHEGTVEQVLYDTNFSRHFLGNEIVYCHMTPYAKVFQLFLSNMFLHKNNLRDHVIELGRYAIYHLMTEMPFNFPNLIYFNWRRSIKNLHKDVY